MGWTPQRIPIAVAPSSGEALDSWIEAYARRLRTCSTDLLYHLGLPGARLAHMIMLLTAGERDILAAATGIAPHTLTAATLEPFDGVAVAINRANRTATHPPAWRRQAGSRFCPACLRDNGGRWRLEWRLPWTFACPTHHCLLIDLCPACGRRPAPHRPSFGSPAPPGACTAAVLTRSPNRWRVPVCGHAEHLAALAGQWLAARLPEPTVDQRRAIAVDGKTLRGSADGDESAQHVLAAAEHDTGTVLAQTDVDGRTNEITRFAPLLDQMPDLAGVVVTADALHCQREHVTYLHGRGAHWVLTVKRNQPGLYAQLAGLPWRAVPDGHRTEDRGHGRREIRTIKVLTLASGIDFPHAVQAIQVRRRRRRLDQAGFWKTETIYAITDLGAHHGRPDRLAGWIRGHWHVENKVHWVRDVTYDEDRSQIRTGTGAQVMAAIRNLAIAALRLAGVTNIAAANRHHARNPARPLDLLGVT